jgi:hypothetical protein
MLGPHKNQIFLGGHRRGARRLSAQLHHTSPVSSYCAKYVRTSVSFGQFPPGPMMCMIFCQRTFKMVINQHR